MKGLHRTKIDYCAYSGEQIGREGYVLNLITGCKHGCPYCYARNLVEHGRLKGSPSYPYGFEPTLHIDRIRPIGGKPKLIFLNDMGDVGGDWDWRVLRKKCDADLPISHYSSHAIADLMVRFANLNPQHILLLLTKIPAWYALADWPDNVWCGFTATNNVELKSRCKDIFKAPTHNIWISLEPWLDQDSPRYGYFNWWRVIGGLSGRNPQPVSEITRRWIESFAGKLFVKSNAWGPHFEKLDLSKPMEIQKRREYPDAWRIP